MNPQAENPHDLNPHEGPAWADGLESVQPLLARLRDAVTGAATLAALLRMDSNIAETRTIYELDESDLLKVGVPFTPATVGGLQAALRTTLEAAETFVEHMATAALRDAPPRRTALGAPDGQQNASGQAPAPAVDAAAPDDAATPARKRK